MGQQGSIFASHGAWYVRYRSPEKQPDGTIKNVQRAHKLANTKDYPKKAEVKPLADEYMNRLKKIGLTPETAVSVVTFAEDAYFPAAESRLEQSTVWGYRRVWNRYLKPQFELRAIRVRDFRTVDGENLMQVVGQEHAGLAHETYKQIKSVLSAVFTQAKRLGVYEGVNPMTGVAIPKGKRHGRKTSAYSLEEIKQHLNIFNVDKVAVPKEDGEPYVPTIPGRLVRAIIGVAAFTGLREGEIRGLWWSDDDGELLNVRRSVWRTHIKTTKTGEDDVAPGIVPIIRPLRLLLDNIRPEHPHGWMFANGDGGAVNLKNLANRVIKPLFKLNALEWKGWHAYRRGLATNLKRLGIADETIQAILRHEDVGTTQRSYIKMVRPDVTIAMQQLESQCAALVQQQVPAN